MDHSARPADPDHRRLDLRDRGGIAGPGAVRQPRSGHVKGRATNTTLLPGPHFVLAFRRRMVEEYPSIELAYRAGGPTDTQETRREGARPVRTAGPAGRFQDLDQAGPAWPVTLGDRVTATIVADHQVSAGSRSAATGPRKVRSERHLRHRSGREQPSGDELPRPDRRSESTACSGRRGQATRRACGRPSAQALLADGIRVTALVLGDVDLGRTGEVIQATARARHELGGKRPRPPPALAARSTMPNWGRRPDRCRRSCLAVPGDRPVARSRATHRAPCPSPCAPDPARPRHRPERHDRTQYRRAQSSRYVRE